MTLATVEVVKNIKNVARIRMISWLLIEQNSPKSTKSILRSPDEDEELDEFLYLDELDEEEDVEDNDIYDLLEDDIEEDDVDDFNFLDDDLSEEDNQLIENWWDEYVKMESAEGIRLHNEKFMAEHPELAVHLDIYNDVVIKIGEIYRKERRVNEYIDFLMRYRENHPEAYAEYAGYMDAEIIAWLIMNDRGQEVERYFENFISRAVEFEHALNGVVELLLAKDMLEPALYLIEKTKEIISNEFELSSKYQLFAPFVYILLPTYLNREHSLENSTGFISEVLKALPYELEKKKILNEWHPRIGSILRPFEPWDYQSNLGKNKKKGLYLQMSDNFSRYLHDEVGISWTNAFYHASLIFYYANAGMDKMTRKTKKLFNFKDDSLLETIQYKNNEVVLSPDAAKAFSTLNAIYYFAEYLDRCGMKNEVDKEEVQKTVTKLYEILYPRMVNLYTEALCFGKFPFFSKEV